MSIQKVAEYFFPAGNFAQIRANAPDRATYNIESTRDLVENQPLLMTPFAPVGAAAMSIPYDLVQASMRARDTFFKDNPTAFGITDDAEVPIGPSMVDFASAVAAENPIDSLIERTQGATEGLARRITRAPEFLNNLFFTTAYAPEITAGERKSIERQPSSFKSLSDPEDYEGPEREGILSRILNKGKEIGGGIVDAAKGAGSALSNLGIVGALRSLDQFKNLSQADQRFILQQAGGNVPGKDRFGYNIRSAFGNYASLVGDRADIARERQARGLPLRAIDLYYLNQEKERQKVLQEQIQESIDQGRSMQQSYEDSYASMGYSSPAERAADTPTGTLGRV